ncbi:hypothetical protein V2J09_019780 [Rumex salicifolius]
MPDRFFEGSKWSIGFHLFANVCRGFQAPSDLEITLAVPSGGVYHEYSVRFESKPFPLSFRMDLILEAKDSNDWSYRGEGAANLVLSYNGTSPELAGKVIRVPKVSNDGSLYENGHLVWSEHEQMLWKDAGSMVTASTKEIADQLFMECVMIPLLGGDSLAIIVLYNFIDKELLRHVLVSREFLESVERNTLLQRPNWRVLASKVNMACDSVHLMSDHSVFPYGDSSEGPCICVEIKPKCGFLPSSRFISEKNAIKKKVSRFKMHQALKLHIRQILQPSEYDPLDLFSGSRDGIHKAVNALFSVPQNNLRVFLDGSLVYGSLGGGMNGTTFMNSEAFEDYIKCLVQADDGLCMSSFKHLVAETIFKLGVMDRLLEVQKLDNLDIEGAIHAYYDAISHPCIACRNLEQEQRCRYAPLHSIPLEESIKIVKNYLISATGKDCSLMICFRLKKDDDLQSCHGSISLDCTGQIFDYKAYFIDLDLKPLVKMEHYYQLDQKIVNNYNQMDGTESGTIKAATCRRMYEFSAIDGFVELTKSLGDMIKYLANEPSLGLYYIQHHAQNAVPNAINLKNNILETSHESNLHAEDLEDSIAAVRSMQECGFPIADAMIGDIKKSLAIMSTKQPIRGLIQPTNSSFWVKSSGSWSRSSVNIQENSEKTVGYLSNVLKSAKQKAGNLKWPQLDQLREIREEDSIVEEHEARNPPESDSADMHEEAGNVMDNVDDRRSFGFDSFKADKEARLEYWLKDIGNMDQERSGQIKLLKL